MVPPKSKRQGDSTEPGLPELLEIEWIE